VGLGCDATSLVRHVPYACCSLDGSEGGRGRSITITRNELVPHGLNVCENMQYRSVHTSHHLVFANLFTRTAFPLPPPRRIDRLDHPYTSFHLQVREMLHIIESLRAHRSRARSCPTSVMYTPIYPPHCFLHCLSYSLCSIHSSWPTGL
jgi:hypothetical protein